MPALASYYQIYLFCLEMLSKSQIQVTKATAVLQVTLQVFGVDNNIQQPKFGLQTARGACSIEPLYHVDTSLFP